MHTINRSCTRIVLCTVYESYHENNLQHNTTYTSSFNKTVNSALLSLWIDPQNNILLHTIWLLFARKHINLLWLDSITCGNILFPQHIVYLLALYEFHILCANTDLASPCCYLWFNLWHSYLYLFFIKHCVISLSYQTVFKAFCGKLTRHDEFWTSLLKKKASSCPPTTSPHCVLSTHSSLYIIKAR